MEVSCLLCGLCQGYLARRQAESQRRLDWRETRRSVQTRVMLECEREYQEHLLLSVMPAYIAAEVSDGSFFSVFCLVTSQVCEVSQLQSEVDYKGNIKGR